MNNNSEKLGKMRLCQTRIFVCATLFSLYCSCAFILGHQLELNSSIDWRLLTILKIVATTVILTIITVKIFQMLLTRQPKQTKDFKITTKWKTITILTLLIPQIIVLLVMYPGCYGYDGGTHVIQFVDENTPIRTHCSVLYTVFLGFVIETFQTVKSITFGMALAMLIQSLISIFALYKLVLFVSQKTNGRCAYFCTLLFSALFPFALILRVSTSQDVLFGAFFLLSAIELCKVGERFCSKGSNSHESFKVREYIPFCVWSSLMMLMRNSGVYMMLFVIIACLPVFWKKKDKLTLGALLTPVIVFYIISGPVFSALGVLPSKITVTEMSSLPSQQLTRAFATSPNSFTEDEAQTFENIFSSGEYKYASDDVSWYWSQSEIADVAKARINQDFVKKNLGESLGLYINIGIKCPKAYVDAFFMNTLGFWYPLKEYPDERMYHPYIEYETIDWGSIIDGCPDIPRSSFFPSTDNNIASFLKAGWNSDNQLTIVMKSGFYLLVFMFCLAYAIYSKRRGVLFVFALFASLVVTFFLSPVALFRYVYPLVISSPLLFLVFSTNNRSLNS